MDPNMMNSIHLEGNPRRQLFREIRERLNSAAGSHTIIGNVRVQAANQSPDALTIVPEDIPVRNGPIQCFILDRGRKLFLKIGMNSVGRLPDNDVVIDDATVSRRHCAILVHSDLSCELHDVASKNGTMLNGRKINGPTSLKDGDEITLCERKIQFLVSSKAVAKSSAPPVFPQSNGHTSDHTQINLSGSH